MSAPIGLVLLLLAARGSIAKPVIVQPISSNQELTTVLMSDKLLGPFLLLNAIQLIFFLIKAIWSSEKKKLESIERAVSQIPALMHKLDQLDGHVKQNVLTKDQTQLLVWKELRDRGP